MKLFMGTESGKPAADQEVFYTEDGLYLKSYNSIVAFRPHPYAMTDKFPALGKEAAYSNTTKRYVRLFMAGFEDGDKDIFDSVCRNVDVLRWHTEEQE